MHGIRKDDMVETTIETVTIKRGTQLPVVRVSGSMVFCESPTGNEVWFDADRGEVKSLGHQR